MRLLCVCKNGFRKKKGEEGGRKREREENLRSHKGGVKLPRLLEDNCRNCVSDNGLPSITGDLMSHLKQNLEEKKIGLSNQE